ncbi:VOC family protein [Actinacidiphila acididurans]|uniref:VOC family protein n=1 Tax=Actinacidiphila acididurans TaxID=2784346 RepID=A0ABS2TI98_9ACTN|nr:VOC family protein [Actinacidiphila acididurans]MBM9503072.1 VOC family protein [Actinacidiphila acididurans]
MTNESAAEPTSDFIEHHTTPSQARFGMVVLYVRDLQRSIEFYRLLGLDVSDPDSERPVAAYKEGDATRMIITTDPIAQRFDSGWARPGRGGYQQVVEFFVDDDAAVDAAWERLTSAGHKGTTAPGHPIGPYATMVEDPDGNVVLITNEPTADADTTVPAV